MAYHVWGMEYRIIESVTDPLLIVVRASENQEKQLSLFLEENEFKLNVLKLADWFIEKRISAFSLAVFDKLHFKLKVDMIQIWESLLFGLKMKRAGLLISYSEYLNDTED